MELEDKVNYYRALLGSPIWTDVILPDLNARYENAIFGAMAGRATLTEAQLRALLGDAANAKRFADMPLSAIQEFDAEQEQEIEEEIQRTEQEARDAYRAEHGMTSVIPPQPGEVEE
jgi:hypothetical protein